MLLAFVAGIVLSAMNYTQSAFVFFSGNHPPLFSSPFAQKSFVARRETKDTIEKIRLRERGTNLARERREGGIKICACVVEAAFDGVCSSVQRLTAQEKKGEELVLGDKGSKRGGGWEIYVEGR